MESLLFIPSIFSWSSSVVVQHSTTDREIKGWLGSNPW